MGIQFWNDNRTYRTLEDYIKVRFETFFSFFFFPNFFDVIIIITGSQIPLPTPVH